MKLELYKTATIEEKYKDAKINHIGYLDIETTGFDAPFNNMLSWSLYKRDVQKPKNNIIFHDVITKAEIDESISKGEVNMDKNIIKTLFKHLQGMDLLVGHYFSGWNKMDVPFVRSRAAICKIPYPFKHKQMRYADTWKMSHMLHKVNSYRLDVIGHLFGVKTEKSPVDYKKWQLAKFGHAPSLKYVLHHNINDVIITHDVHKELEEFMPISGGFV